MNAAGMLGFAVDVRAPVDWQQMGAFVTNPISLRRRMPAARPASMDFTGGFLLHTGLPNPGIESVIKRHAAAWRKSDLPVIVHLMADRPEETARMVEMMEGIENVIAVELGFAPLLADDIVILALEMCRGEMPIIVSIPGPELLRLGARLMERGASALSQAPARGALPSSPSDAPVHGRMYGPSLFPQSLENVVAAARAGLPVIGAGGVWNDDQAQAMLEAGALAVQLDAGLWLPKKKNLVK